MWIFVKLGIYPAGLTCTMSPSLTLRFFLTTLLSLILESSSLLSMSATTTVSFLFFPLMKMASPLNIFNSAIFACESWMEEFSSFKAYSTWDQQKWTINLLGAFFWSRMAVDTSFLGSICWNIITFEIFLNLKKWSSLLGDKRNQNFLLRRLPCWLWEQLHNHWECKIQPARHLRPESFVSSGRRIFVQSHLDHFWREEDPNRGQVQDHSLAPAPWRKEFLPWSENGGLRI